MEALREYLQTNYPYNLTAQPEPPELDPVEWFLFYEQQGICTDFASALTMMTRSIGLPARVVTGYLVNPDMEVQDVYLGQGHAYTEVLFDDIGWIIFDATPTSGPTILDPTGMIPTFTNITHQDSTVNVGEEFIVTGTVIDDTASPVSGLEILVYLKQEKTDSGILSGEGIISDGLFNVSCLFPPNLPPGEYMVDAHTLGDDTYMDSWSDPPLTAYSETSFIIEAPPKVIAGRTYTVNATLVDHNTNQSIPSTRCQATVGETEFNLRTDQQGSVQLSTQSDEGTVDLVFNWNGNGYILGSDTSKTIQSIPLRVNLPSETVLIRGERNIIRGQVKAQELEGRLEPISLQVLGDKINSVTNERGEFFLAKTVPKTTELGATPLTFEILNDHLSSTEYAYVKSRAFLDLETPITGQAGKETNVKITLSDDTGAPIQNQQVNITYTNQNSTILKSVYTDPEGSGELKIKLPKDQGSIQIKANYKGHTNYMPSTASQVVNIIAPTKFPLLQLASIILLIGGVAGIFYLRDQRQSKIVEIEDMELVNTAWSDELNIQLVDIEPDLPAVWDPITPLKIHGTITHVDKTPRPGETLSLQLDDTIITSDTSNSEGIIHHSQVINSLGVHKLTLLYTPEELKTGLDIKIVEYRTEIIRLFNNRFKESREMFQTIQDHYTARELYEYLKLETPEQAHEPLRELVFIFEEANYSLHEVNREHYTRFFREMRKYKEALNGEDS